MEVKLKEIPVKEPSIIHLQVQKRDLNGLSKSIVERCKRHGIYTAELLTGRPLPKDLLTLK